MGEPGEGFIPCVRVHTRVCVSACSAPSLLELPASSLLVFFSPSLDRSEDSRHGLSTGIRNSFTIGERCCGEQGRSLPGASKLPITGRGRVLIPREQLPRARPRVPLNPMGQIQSAYSIF